jgi:hypothetical protein
MLLLAAQQFTTGLGLRASCQHAAEKALGGGRSRDYRPPPYAFPIHAYYTKCLMWPRDYSDGGAYAPWTRLNPPSRVPYVTAERQRRLSSSSRRSGGWRDWGARWWPFYTSLDIQLSSFSTRYCAICLALSDIPLFSVTYAHALCHVCPHGWPRYSAFKLLGELPSFVLSLR